MRKKTILIITSVLLVLCSFLTACTLSDFNGCSSKNDGVITEELKPDDSIKESKLNFEIEKNGWYYATFTGVLVFDSYPDMVTLTCNGIETELAPSKVRYINEKFEFTYEHQIVYNNLSKGYHSAVVACYTGPEKTILNDKLSLYADTDYVGLNAANFKTGQTEIGMDKAENWS